MNIRQAERKQVKIKIGVQGPSGSGKTYSSLLIAKGLSDNWNKICVIDTEKAKMEVIILDSISHEWDGSGGVLDIHGSMAGNSFTNWNKITPRHNAFVQKILQSKCHIIATVRSKQDYVLVEKNGKHVPEKVGLKGITREGMDYEFTVVLDLDINHHVSVSKDRTGLFTGKPTFKATVGTGRIIKDWCLSGVSIYELMERIKDASSTGQLKAIFNSYPEFQAEITPALSKRKMELELAVNEVEQPKFKSNGIDTSK